MEFSVLFARHLARLAWLLAHEPGSTEEQKAALRAMVAVSKFGPITVEPRDWRLVANGHAVPDASEGVLELVAQLVAAGVRRVHFATAPAAAPLLGLARSFTRGPANPFSVEEARARLAALDVTSVSVEYEPPAFDAPRSPRVEARVVAPEPDVLPAPAGRPDAHAPNGDDGLVILHGVLHEIDSDPAMRPPPHETVTEPATAPAAELTAPVAPPAPNGSNGSGPRGVHSLAPPPSDAVRGAGFVLDDGNGMWLHFSAVQTSKTSPHDLFAQLDRFHTVDAVTRVLNELVVIAENGAREGKPLVVADVFCGIVRREASSSEPEIKRAYGLTVRRMARPPLLRAVAHLLPRKRDRQEDYVAVLVRTGEDGADALIDQLTQAQTADDRRIMFDVLLKLQAGVPALIHMTGDARWFVARNAAELLGEMRAVAAEDALKQLLRHQDDRVRRAAATALTQLDTPSARQALLDTMKDGTPQLRMHAASALAGRGDEKSAGTLTRALDDEEDPDVQLAIIMALGKVATPEAVRRLVRAAEPDSRMFFRRRATPLRVAAVQALGEARTPAALAALHSLRDDRERDVREAVARVLRKP